MREPWEILTTGPPDAARSVLLLPGGAMAARSFSLVMAEPVVSPFRLVATTLPGMAGAPLSGDVSIPGLARHAGELAKQHGCDVVVGFSHGATVALDMVLSGHFHGAVVLLGISLTTPDESGFFRSVVRASEKVGVWPMATLLRLLPLMATSAKPRRATNKNFLPTSSRTARGMLSGLAARTWTTSPRNETQPHCLRRRAAPCGGFTRRRETVASPSPNAPPSRPHPTSPW